MTYVFKNPFIKKLLQFFIAIIDAELFETVHFEKLYDRRINSIKISTSRVEKTEASTVKFPHNIKDKIIEIKILSINKPLWSRYHCRTVPLKHCIHCAEKKKNNLVLNLY